MKKQKHESAFPSYQINKVGQISMTNIKNNGMTLRDYFAGKILQGFLANGIDNTVEHLKASGYGDLPVCDDISAFSYRIADSMIKEREK